MPIAPFNLEGLSDQEVLIARKQFGNNQLSFKKNNGFLDALKSIFKEPMVILLLAAASIYFITGNAGDGLFLAGAILLVAAISLYQDARSKQALQKLEEFTQPFCKVIRNKEIVSIHVDELVIGDYLLIEEGNSVSADGLIIQSNDFSVNESILTGETFAVSKSNNSNDNQIYRGTYAVAGLAIAQITAIGNDSKLGRIGKSLESIVEEKTPLEKQINRFVRNMAI
ncbi:MAG: HAD-IC family P-type ATPase, partial [Sediminibacterium sp.]|nr:HAD-IC family P-type ATPase [Sediminibacterium sp.]